MALFCPFLCFVSLFVINVLANGENNPHYTVTPLKLGIEIRDIDIKEHIDQEVIDSIVEQIKTHGLLVFRGQGMVNGSRQVEISEWFGDIASSFGPSPDSPHRHIFMVSNLRKKGKPAGRYNGKYHWHTDGNFEAIPHGYTLFHIVQVPSAGDTMFLSTTNLVSELTEEQKVKWRQLHVRDQRDTDVVNPIMMHHPGSGLETIVFGLDQVHGLFWNFSTEQQKFVPAEERDLLFDEIKVELDKAPQYSHKWIEGDFIVVDNFALAHMAAPEVHLAYEEIGARVIHRTTVKGLITPGKGMNEVYLTEEEKTEFREKRKGQPKDHTRRRRRHRPRYRDEERLAEAHNSKQMPGAENEKVLRHGQNEEENLLHPDIVDSISDVHDEEQIPDVAEENSLPDVAEENRQPDVAEENRQPDVAEEKTMPDVHDIKAGTKFSDEL